MQFHQMQLHCVIICSSSETCSAFSVYAVICSAFVVYAVIICNSIASSNAISD